MTKNKLGDLNNHLFAQLERLSDEDLKPDEIVTEAARADAIVAVADKILAGADLQLKAAKLLGEHGVPIEKPDLKLINGGSA